MPLKVTLNCLYGCLFLSVFILPSWLKSYEHERSDEKAFLKKLSQARGLSGKTKHIKRFLDEVDSKLDVLTLGDSKQLSSKDMKRITGEIIYLNFLRSKLEVLKTYKSCRSKEVFLKNYLVDPYKERFIDTKSSYVALRALKSMCPKLKLGEWVPLEVREALFSRSKGKDVKN